MARKARRAARVLRLLPAYVTLGVLKRVMPLDALARWAWRPPRFARDPAREWEIQSDLHALWRVTPLRDRDCVQRSLLLYRELSVAGANPTLVAGFKQTGGRIEGHAWVVVDGKLTGERPDSIQEFAPAFTFGARGERSIPPDPAAS